MINAMSSIDNSKKLTQDVPEIKSLKDLQENPDFFPIWSAEIQRKNLSFLLSSSSAEDALSSQSNSSVLGMSDSTDALSSITGLGYNSSSSDALSSLFSSSSNSSTDLTSLLSSSSMMDSYKVSETLQELQNYSNVSESKSWLNQLVTYTDPSDKLVKTGRVSRIDIENVSKPLFYVNDTELTLDQIKSLEADSSAQLNNSVI